MSEHEHVVKVYPIRLESPAIVAGRRYQIAFVRGKTKAKAPRPITSTEASALDLSALGCFSKAIVHFKESKKKGPAFQPKMVSFEFLDCSADPHGARLGEAEVDVSPLLSAAGECNREVRHPFRMCGYGATLIVGIVVQRLVNGKPVGGEAEYGGAASSASQLLAQAEATAAAAYGVAASAAHATMAHAAAVAASAYTPPSPQSPYYMPRDSAIAVLSRVEECTKTAALNARTVAEATAGSANLGSLLESARSLVTLNLDTVPERTLLSKMSVQREANRYGVALADRDEAAADEYLNRLLAQARERLTALQRAEALVHDEEKQILSALGNGTPMSMELERDPPLPLLLFCRTYNDVKGTVVVPSTPTITQPPVSVQVPLSQQHLTAAKAAEVAAALAAAASQQTTAAVAKVAEVVAAPPPIPGTAAMANLFGGVPPQEEAPAAAAPPRNDGSPADLVPNLFGDSPAPKAAPKDEAPHANGSNGSANLFNEPRHDFGGGDAASSRQQTAAEEPHSAEGGLGSDMFGSAVNRASDAAAAAKAKVMEGLGTGMFNMGGNAGSSNETTPRLAASASAAAPSGLKGFSVDMFGGTDATPKHDARPSAGSGGVSVSMFQDAAAPSGFGGGGGVSISSSGGGAGMFGGAPEVTFGGSGGGGFGVHVSAQPTFSDRPSFGGAEPSFGGGGFSVNAFAPTPERADAAPSVGFTITSTGGDNPFGADTSGGW